MGKLIDDCASDVTELIDDQIEQIGHERNRRTKVRADACLSPKDIDLTIA
jgi:hypothetical protein